MRHKPDLLGIPQDQSYGHILAFGLANLGSWGKDWINITLFNIKRWMILQNQLNLATKILEINSSKHMVTKKMWQIIRKDQLSIIGLVSLYLTNYLILRGLIKQRFLAFFRIWPELFGRFPRVTHPFATLFSTVLTSWARQATFS